MDAANDRVEAADDRTEVADDDVLAYLPPFER
jgi:hypothetical protein